MHNRLANCRPQWLFYSEVDNRLQKQLLITVDYRMSVRRSRHKVTGLQGIHALGILKAQSQGAMPALRRHDSRL